MLANMGLWVIMIAMTEREIPIIEAVVTDKDGNEVTNGDRGPHLVTRRQMFVGMTVTGLTTLTLGAVAGRADVVGKFSRWLDRTLSDEPAPLECADPDEGVEQYNHTSEIVVEPTGDVLLDTLESGVKKEWWQLEVYPGVLILEPGVKVRRSPFATDGEIILEKNMYVQRPLHVRPTIDANRFRVGTEGLVELAQGGIPEGMIGFFLPDSNNMAYVDFNQEFVGIDRFTRARSDGTERDVVESAAVGLTQERVTLDGRHLLNGQIHPYLLETFGGKQYSYIDQEYYCADEQVVDFIVLMRAAYVDDPKQALIDFDKGKPAIEIPTVKK